MNNSQYLLGHNNSWRGWNFALEPLQTTHWVWADYRLVFSESNHIEVSLFTNTFAKNLHNIPNLKRLNLATLSCNHHGLLSRHGQAQGWQFAHLARITHLQLSDVGPDMFQSIGTFCTNLVDLRVSPGYVTPEDLTGLSLFPLSLFS